VGGGEQASNVAPKGAFERMKDIEKQVNEAVNYFQGILLPWAVARLEKGERLDPRLHSAEAGRQFDILLKSLSADGYAAVLGPDSPLGEAERKAFAQMAEATKTAVGSGPAAGENPGVPPQGTNTPSTETK